jgi:Fur family ferric uptake transcriptional regulator
MDDATVLTDALRQHGYRVTPPRRLVWEVLAESRAHLTADEIAARIARDHEEVNLASVYRALGLLEDLDLVRSSRLGNESTTTWELAHPDEHFHIVCASCGRVEHHRGTLVDEIAGHLRQAHGFRPTTIELVVTGFCRDCAGREG